MTVEEIDQQKLKFHLNEFYFKNKEIKSIDSSVIDLKIKDQQKDRKF